MTKQNLVRCDQFVNNNGVYTYFHESLNLKRWIDHFLISSSIAPMKRYHEIIDVGDNPSGHLPIKLSRATFRQNWKIQNGRSKNFFKMGKCSEEQKSSFSNRLDELLHPSVMTQCDGVYCQREDCAVSIQNEYDRLVIIVTQADKVLPRHYSTIRPREERIPYRVWIIFSIFSSPDSFFGLNLCLGQFALACGP